MKAVAKQRTTLGKPRALIKPCRPPSYHMSLLVKKWMFSFMHSSDAPHAEYHHAHFFKVVFSTSV